MNTRWNYEKSRTDARNELSTFSGRYYLDTPGNGPTPCYVADPQIRIQGWGANLRTNPIEIENSLKCLGRENILTKPQYCKITTFGKQTMPPSHQLVYPTCDSFLTTEQSRAILPAWLFKEIPQNRYSFLPINPQVNVCKPFQNNLSTRILEKDYFTTQKVHCL